MSTAKDRAHARIHEHNPLVLEAATRPEEVADLIAHEYRESVLAGENPDLRDFLDMCPTPEIRDLVRTYCNFENLAHLGLKIIERESVQPAEPGP